MRFSILVLGSVSLALGTLGMAACASSSGGSSGASGSATTTTSTTVPKTDPTDTVAPVDTTDPGEMRPVDVPVVTGGDVNPDGVAYPAGPFGVAARRGAARGDTIKNMKFSGYINADKAGGVKQFSWADFYDPTSKRAKMMNVQVSGVWCSVCVAEQKVVAKRLGDWSKQGVMWVTIIIEGASGGVDSQPGDLDKWLTITKPTNTVGLDSGRATLSGFVKQGGLPYSMWVDLRNMEVIRAQEGSFTDVAAGDADIAAQLKAFSTREAK
jgi:hypothetical protein